jgi:autotransporter translocation and assembly factor TamB
MRLRVDIDATARGRSGRYDITLRLRGPLDTGEQSTQDLRVDVTSDPPLSSDEAFAQLLGTAVLNRGGLEGQGDEAYARAIVGLLSGPLFSGIERSIGEALGLDTIALDYRIDEPIGIEIGKAIGDRLYISYRRTLQRTPGQKMPFDLRIEYRIKGNLELGLETNELDERKITLEKRWRF